MRESWSRSCRRPVQERNRRHAIDAVLRRIVIFEDEVHLFDRYPFRELRQLVQNLPRLQTRFASERLRQEQQAHGPVISAKASRSFC